MLLLREEKLVDTIASSLCVSIVNSFRRVIISFNKSMYVLKVFVLLIYDSFRRVSLFRCTLACLLPCANAEDRARKTMQQ